MKISRTRSYRLNMGNYETQELSATITVSDTDLLEQEDIESMTADEVRDVLKEYAIDTLELLLKDDIAEAGKLSAASDSMLFSDPPPRRTQRVRKT